DMVGIVGIVQDRELLGEMLVGSRLRDPGYFFLVSLEKNSGMTRLKAKRKTMLQMQQKMRRNHS
ncbi:MAG: hypothetical protein KDE26_32235, partial [Bacteroidetes bacterium]|nr:hypothetical protein [Bacteroidota bacterium]